MNAVATGRSVMRTVLWNDLLKTSRRASRYEYWWGTIQIYVVIIAVLLLGMAAIRNLPEQHAVPAVMALTAIFVLSLVASFTLQVRRLHDLGMNWWWAAVMLAISLASGIYDEYIANLQLDRYLFVQWQGEFFEDIMSLTWLDGLSNGVGLMLFIMSGFFIGDDGANEWGKGPAQWPHRRVRATGRREDHAMDESFGVEDSPWSRDNEGHSG